MRDLHSIPIENELGFRTLFESVPGLYLILLPDFTICAVNDAYAAATMTKREEIVGRYLFDVFPDNPDDHNADGVSNLHASLNHVLKYKTAHTMAVQKYDIRTPDGVFEERYWSPHNKPILNSDGEVIYIIHRVENVTDFIRLQKVQKEKDKVTDDLRSQSLNMEREIIKRSQEIQKLNAELEQKVTERTATLELLNKDISDYKFAMDASSIVSVTDSKGIIQHVNDNFCEISKYRRDELIGQDHRIINSAHHHKHFIRNLWNTIAGGKIWKGELKNKAKDGSVFWVETTIVPILDVDGKPNKYLAIRANITQRKMAEERVLKLNEELEIKVKERTLELTAAFEREQSMNEMKSRFVSMASHEFRTPLSAILSSVSLIDTYKNQEDEEKRKKHIERIKSSIRNLTGILNDFLSLDKLEHGKAEIAPEPINLEDFGHDIVEEMRSMLKPGQLIIFKRHGNNEIVQDKKILRNVLLNLLSNAIKYSGEDTVIDFRVDAGDDGLVRISVEDHGMGIPEEEQKNLFDKFFRAKNAINIQGTGLGLNIVKKYIELLGGQISFTSELYKGTNFIIEFPQNSAA